MNLSAVELMKWTNEDKEHERALVWIHAVTRMDNITTILK